MKSFTVYIFYEGKRKALGCVPKINDVTEYDGQDDWGLYFFRSSAKSLDYGTGETDGERRFRAGGRAGESRAQLLGRGVRVLRRGMGDGRRKGGGGAHCRKLLE